MKYLSIYKDLGKDLYSSDKLKEIIGISFNSQLIEEISIYTMNEFLENQIDYLTADTIVNNLWDYWVTDEQFPQNYDFPKVSLKIYEAFDSGEYSRPNEDLEDPVEKYTIPQLKEIQKIYISDKDNIV